MAWRRNGTPPPAAVRSGGESSSVTKGAGSRVKALVMAYKLLDMAQQRWCRLNAPHLLPLVRAGVLFVDGVQQEREEIVTPRRKAA